MFKKILSSLNLILLLFQFSCTAFCAAPSLPRIYIEDGVWINKKSDGQIIYTDEDSREVSFYSSDIDNLAVKLNAVNKYVNTGCELFNYGLAVKYNLPEQSTYKDLFLSMQTLPTTVPLDNYQGDIKITAHFCGDTETCEYLFVDNDEKTALEQYIEYAADHANPPRTIINHNNACYENYCYYSISTRVHTHNGNCYSNSFGSNDPAPRCPSCGNAAWANWNEGAGFYVCYCPNGCTYSNCGQQEWVTTNGSCWESELPPGIVPSRCELLHHCNLNGKILSIEITPNKEIPDDTNILNEPLSAYDCADKNSTGDITYIDELNNAVTIDASDIEVLGNSLNENISTINNINTKVLQKCEEKYGLEGGSTINDVYALLMSSQANIRINSQNFSCEKIIAQFNNETIELVSSPIDGNAWVQYSRLYAENIGTRNNGQISMLIYTPM